MPAINSALDGSFSSSECRQRAEDYREQRNAVLRQAASAARQHRQGKGGAASVYAEQARHFNTLAQQWQMRAASALVEQRRTESTGSETLDLHGLTVPEALSVVQRCLTRWQGTPLSEGYSRRAPLHIVTGRGIHSHNRLAVVRPAVQRLVLQQGFACDTNSDPGVLVVRDRR